MLWKNIFMGTFPHLDSLGTEQLLSSNFFQNVIKKYTKHQVNVQRFQVLQKFGSYISRCPVSGIAGYIQSICSQLETHRCHDFVAVLSQNVTLYH